VSVQWYLEGVILRPAPLTPEVSCADVHKRFAGDRGLVTVAVVEAGRPVGLVHRHEFLLGMSHRFGRALFDKRPIRVLMDKNPLIVDVDETITSVNERIIGERPAALLQGFIVASAGQYVGVGTAISLLKAMTDRMTEKTSELSIAGRRAEEANRAKSQFLATMTHELRTPLNAILGFSELIRDEHLGPVGNPRYAEYANDIHSSGRHLLSIIRDVLDMARIDAGKVELQDELIDIESCIAGTLRLIHGQAAQAGIDLRAETDAFLPHVMADPVRLKQVLLNLLGNAVKFSDNGGVVTVRAQCSDDGSLRIAIADTGIGIPADKLGLVLEPFSQAHENHRGSIQGSGLGLPISKSLMELHDGDMTIESVEGAGTTVTLRLPADRVQHFREPRTLRPVRFLRTAAQAAMPDA
jgi:two-component system cell cycle sensor histidine kinase PleC